MNSTQSGLIAGLILGIAAVIGGFTGFVITVALGIIGLVVGRLLDGDTEIGDLLGRGKDR